MTKITPRFKRVITSINAGIMADIDWIMNAHPDKDRMGIGVVNDRINGDIDARWDIIRTGDVDMWWGRPRRRKTPVIRFKSYSKDGEGGAVMNGYRFDLAIMVENLKIELSEGEDWEKLVLKAMFGTLSAEERKELLDGMSVEFD